MRVLVVIAAMMLGASAGAQSFDTGYPEGQAICVAEGIGRDACYRDWERSLRLFITYAQDKGYVTEDGGLGMGSMVSALWDWRVVLGLPPKDPFYFCAGVGETAAGVDYRALWSCIVKRDPDAARMDAI